MERRHPYVSGRATGYGVDGLAVRADGGRLAMEHTVIERFARDIADQSEMLPLLAGIEDDPSLAVPGLWIQVFVPVGTLHLQKTEVRQADFGRDYIRFELCRDGELASSCDFDGTQLLTRYEDGFAEVVHRVGA